MEQDIYRFFHGIFGGINEVLGDIYLIPIKILGVPLPTLLLGVIALISIIKNILQYAEE